MIRRAVAVLGLGCLGAGLSHGTAVAPVGVAQASIAPLAIGLPLPVRMEIAPVDIVLPGPDLPGPLLIESERAEPVIRFGSRDVPRRVVDPILRAAETTGVDAVYLMALADKESSFRPEARAPTSSAEGMFQFIDRTWLEMVRVFGPSHGLAEEAAAIAVERERPVVADEARRTAILDLRRDPYVSAVMAAEMLRRDSSLIGERIGRTLSRAELYLAHFLGLSDALRFLELRDGKRKPAAAKLFPAAARANAAIFFERGRRGRRGLTLPEVYARLDRMIEARAERFGDVAARLNGEEVAVSRAGS